MVVAVVVSYSLFLSCSGFMFRCFLVVVSYSLFLSCLLLVVVIGGCFLVVNGGC